MLWHRGVTQGWESILAMDLDVDVEAAVLAMDWPGYANWAAGELALSISGLTQAIRQMASRSF